MPQAKSLRPTVVILLIWLLSINVFALLALNRFNLKGDTAYTWINPDEFSQQQSWDLPALHAHWDSVWYLDVARNGYSYKGPGQLSNIAFFPLYPLLIKGFSLIIFGDQLLAGWILSMVFLMLAGIYLHRLVKEFHPKVDPQLPVILLLIFPTAFFLNAVYTESLFLFLSVASFYYAFRKNFLLAGILGFFAALTRSTGVLLAVPLVWEYFRVYGFRKGFTPKALALLLPPLGTASFFLYHYLRFGDFLLWLKVEAWWGRAFKFNKDHFLLMSNPAVINLLLDISFILAIAVITYLVFKKLRVSYGLYMAVTAFVALGTGTMMSIGRYILVLFPMFILLAGIKNRDLLFAWAFPSVLLLAMDVTLFVNDYWAG